MSYDFSPLISQYCKAKEQYCKAKEQYCETEEQYRKAEKAKESSNYFLRKKKSELFHSILKNGTLYPCPEGVDREDYTLLKNEAIAEALIVVCEEYDPTKSNLS